MVWVMIVTILLGIIGMIMVITGSVRKDHKNFGLVRATCGIVYDLNDTVCMLRLYVSDTLYTKPVEGILGEYTPCYYKEGKLPESLNQGDSPSIRTEVILMSVGGTLLGVFLILTFIHLVYACWILSDSGRYRRKKDPIVYAG